ncbi:MAG TPA: MHYT domain-containing protein [Gammaproteobacteria bacterium]|nr:MHYT domain-containing protein [Gammaproteobacteria bacterium]
MNSMYTNIVGTYDIWLVILSYVVSTLGSFTALQLAGHVIDDKQKSRRLLWIIAAAIALGGGGIWSMHFIAMLAYKLPIAVNYDITITVASLIAAIVVTGIGLFIVTGRDLSMGRLCAAGAFVGVGVCTMHYIGMEAMRMTAELSYDPLIFALSFVVAIVVATVGLLLMVTMRRGVQRVISAFVIAFAVSGMHYTGMFGTTCQLTFSPAQDDIAVTISPNVMAASIAAATIAILLLSLLISFVGKRRSPGHGAMAQA